MMPLNLNRREKYYVAGAAVIIILLVFSQLVVSPINKKRERLAGTVVEKGQVLQEMRALEVEYRQIEEKAELAQSSISKRSRNFNLATFLTNLAGELSIGNNVAKMSGPDTDTVGNLTVATVELRFKAITTEQLAKYIHRVEYSGNNLYVKRLTVSQTSKPTGYIDVVLQVETIVS